MEDQNGKPMTYWGGEPEGKSPSVDRVVHTPGPWEFDKSNYGVCNRYGYGLLDSRGDPLGVTVHATDVFHQPIDEAAANAKLIATAPDMFRIIQRLATADWIGESELNLWRKECREIISKVV